ncbi:hypothetical protein ACLB2K_037991 [Fragaria x ananassa]
MGWYLSDHAWRCGRPTKYGKALADEERDHKIGHESCPRSVMMHSGRPKREIMLQKIKLRTEVAEATLSGSASTYLVKKSVAMIINLCYLKEWG